MTLALSVEQATALHDLARVLLAERDRPVPRLLHRVIDIAVPHDLFPRLARWQIALLRVQPFPDGMFVAALDATGASMAAAWWPARPDTAARHPLSFPAAAWVVLHPVLAGIWHDLCADALQVPDARPPRPHPRPEREPPPRAARGRSPCVLPPPRPVPRVAWASADDRARIARACALRGAYRRLPPAWEQRVGRDDFCTRRQAAADRATRYGYPPPPPGFTFVRPHTRGIGEPDPGQHPAARVRPRGLFALALGLQNVPEETVPEEDDDDTDLCHTL
jgi:hypothetical protein